MEERMRIKLLADPSQQSSAAEEMRKQQMQDWLLRVGIAPPVTKESADALCHQQLARQSVPSMQRGDFVKVPLQRSGGMLAVVDTYCLFKRALGTDFSNITGLLWLLE